MAVRNPSSKNSALKQTPKTPKSPASKTPKSVYTHTVEMSDDSMEPVFAKGDLVTIDQMLIEKPGDYVLVRATVGDALDVIRRYDGEPLDGRSKYVPENLAYPVMLEDAYVANLECLGPVSSVRHVNGTIETFDLSTRKKASQG